MTNKENVVAKWKYMNGYRHNSVGIAACCKCKYASSYWTSRQFTDITCDKMAMDCMREYGEDFHSSDTAVSADYTCDSWRSCK
jgi:hypothetical protein